MGAYPDISLKEAGDLRDAARGKLFKGIDPAEQKQRDKRAALISAANSFEAVAKAYIAKNERDGLAEAMVRKRKWFLDIVRKRLGARPIAEIEPYEILDAVRPFEAAKNDEKAHRTLQFIGQVFRFAVANQMAKSDPTRDWRGGIVQSQAEAPCGYLRACEGCELMRVISGYEGQPTTQFALGLSPYVFVRPGELRRAEWSEVNLHAAVWRIPAEKMKGRQ